MPGLVEELQREALDRNIPVSDLLRKALAVSKKLKISHIEEWINNELNGYRSGAKIPYYREVQGQVKSLNPYHGWVPVCFETSEMAKMFSIRKISSSIGELDDLQANRNGGSMLMPFHPEILNKLMEYSDGCEVNLFIPPSSIAGVLDKVRNNILNWALQLEQENILGEGMSFSPKEKEIASKSIYNITNNIGTMHNSQLQQNSKGAVQTMTIEMDIDIEGISNLISEIKESVENLALEEEKQDELLADIETINSQIKLPSPKKIIIIESLKSVRDILTGFASNVLAQGFITEIAKHIPQEPPSFLI